MSAIKASTVKAGDVEVGSESCYQGGCHQGGLWVLLSRRVRVPCRWQRLEALARHAGGVEGRVTEDFDVGVDDVWY